MSKNKEFVTIRFTKNERKIIETYLKRKGFKNFNQFFRQLTMDKLGITLADSEKNPTTLPKEYLLLYDFYSTFSDELNNHTDIKKKFESHFTKYRSEVLAAWSSEENEILWYADKIWNEFMNKKPAGRQKLPKGKRGHPSKKDMSL